MSLFYCLQKEYNSKINVIELTDLDVGESYCFNIQAYIPSRSINKQLGELSQTQCSDDNNNSLSEREVSLCVDRLQGKIVILLQFYVLAQVIQTHLENINAIEHHFLSKKRTYILRVSGRSKKLQGQLYYCNIMYSVMKE